MSKTIKTGGPAFPEIRIKSGDNYNAPQKIYYGGMTLRDYFAAEAMQASLSTIENFPDESWRVDVALDAYAMADAMLAAREHKE